MKICFLTCDKKPGGTEDDKPLAEALVKCGHSVAHAIWSEPAVAWGDYDTCVIRSTWDYHHRLPEFLAWLQDTAAKTILVNPRETVRWNASKEYLLDLQKAGFSIVPTSLHDTEYSALSAIEAALRQGAIVVKPAVSADAEMTFKLAAGDELLPAVRDVLKRGKLLLQPFIESIATDGELSLVYFNVGGHPRFSHCVQKRPQADDFKIQPYQAVSFSPTGPLIKFGETVLSSLKRKWAYARFDVVDWKTDPKIGEIELIEPMLFFKWCPTAAALAAQALEEAGGLAGL